MLAAVVVRDVRPRVPSVKLRCLVDDFSAVAWHADARIAEEEVVQAVERTVELLSMAGLPLNGTKCAVVASSWLSAHRVAGRLTRWGVPVHTSVKFLGSQVGMNRRRRMRHARGRLRAGLA
eukprot:3379956-Amphidinium_carterae.1